jgi:hypothetical protein
MDREASGMSANDKLSWEAQDRNSRAVFLAQSNIDRFKGMLLDGTLEDRKRAILERLLAEAEAKLARLIH